MGLWCLGAVDINHKNGHWENDQRTEHATQRDGECQYLSHVRGDNAGKIEGNGNGRYLDDDEGFHAPVPVKNAGNYSAANWYGLNFGFSVGAYW